MTDEGKMSRAISKAGAADRLSAAPEKAGEPPHFIVPEVAPSAEEGVSSFRLVRGCFGVPKPTVVMVHDEFGEVASQICDLRGRLLAMNTQKPLRTITITSASRKEGKTTLAFNLGVALSELGDGRVVVVDGDLMAPAMHLLANLNAQTGLNDALDGGVELDGNVYETAVPNLDVIPARPVGKDGAREGQLDRNCAALLAELRKFYAYVIIDTPPILAAASLAGTFGRNSDGVVLVVRLEKTSRDVVRHAMDVLTDSRSNVVGCVLTHRKNHIPNFIYGLFGSTPQYYYNYGRSRDKTGTKGS
jgi:capsular exopolysaccharide synthesis family protein